MGKRKQSLNIVGIEHSQNIGKSKEKSKEKIRNCNNSTTVALRHITQGQRKHTQLFFLALAQKACSIFFLFFSGAHK